MSSEKDIDQGGYMRSLHTVRQIIYGPDSPLDNKSKVFLCVEHQTLKWDSPKGEFSYLELSQRTGVPEREVKKSVKRLEKEEMLKVDRRTFNGKSLPNVIGLHPKRFGNDFVERSGKPTFSLINGGKKHVNLSQENADLSTGVPNQTLPGVSKEAPQGCPNSPPEQGLKEPSEPLNSDLKNPLKEQNKKLLKENSEKIEESFTLFGNGIKEKQNAIKVASMVGSLFGSMKR